jgi:hypothetical protein
MMTDRHTNRTEMRQNAVSVTVLVAVCLLAYAIGAPQPKRIAKTDDAPSQLRWGGYNTKQTDGSDKACGPWAFKNSSDICECMEGYHSWVQVGARMPCKGTSCDGGTKLYNSTSASVPWLGCCPPWNGTVCKYTANIPFPYDYMSGGQVQRNGLMSNIVTCDVDITKQIEDIKIFVGIEHNQSSELTVTVTNKCAGIQINLQEKDNSMGPMHDLVAIFDDLGANHTFTGPGTLDYPCITGMEYTCAARFSHSSEKLEEVFANGVNPSGGFIKQSYKPPRFITAINTFLEPDVYRTRCCNIWELEVEDHFMSPYNMTWYEGNVWDKDSNGKWYRLHKKSLHVVEEDGFLHGWGVLLKGCDPVIE